MQDKIAEIREKIEVCFGPEEKEIALNLCDALEVAMKALDFCYPPLAKTNTLAKIDQILEGKNAKG